METRIIKITPEIARKTLEQNTRNRNESASAIKAIAQAMRDGTWMDTGEPIQLGPGDIVINGQTRLAAIVLSGTTQEMVVVSGVEFDAGYVIDGPRRRSTAHAVQRSGQKCTTSAAAVVRRLWVLLTGSEKIPGKAAAEIYASIGKQVTYAEGQCRKYATVGATMSPAPVALAYLLLQIKYGDDQVTRFFESVLSGVRLVPKTGPHELNLKMRKKRHLQNNAEHLEMIKEFIRAFTMPNNRLKLDAAVDAEYDKLIAGLPKSVLKIAGWES